VLGNTLSRNTIQLVAVIVGGVFSIIMLFAAFGGMVIASTAPPAATQAVVVVGGAALILGWLVVPLLFNGVEQTIDPVKLARFPLRTNQLMAAMFLIGVTWVPGIATVAASVGTAIAWRSYPADASLEVATGLVGAATCIAGSRLVTIAVGSLLRDRAVARAAIGVFVAIVIVAPVVAVSLGIIPRGSTNLLPKFISLVDVVGWTPLGAIWSVPGRLALGDPIGAAGAALVGLGTFAGVVALWRFALGRSLRMRGEAQGSEARAGRLGPLAWMPATPTGAVAARSLIYWFRDARLTRQLILIPILPVLSLLWWKVLGSDGLVIGIGPVVASLLPLSMFAAISYDGTAFAAELAAGVRGLHDRLGRAIALLMIALPSTAIVQVAIAFIIGRTAYLPALLGLSLGTLLVSVGVISVSSARIVVPVPRSGRNPFSAQAGSATVSIVASYAVTGVTAACSLPIIGLAIAALVVGAPVLNWLTLAVGLVLGCGLALAGIVLGGRILDNSAPALLARLRLIRA
jgi:ABC-2 type transport system permease protein